MPTLHVDLQEGFTGHEVVVKVDGEERFRGEVRSKLALAIAAHLHFDVGDGPHTIEISIPDRGIAESIEVPDAHHVGIGLGDAGLRVRMGQKPFGYG